MPLVNFRVESDLYARWLKVLSKMRYGQKNHLLRQLLLILVEQLETGKKARLADIYVKKHTVGRS